MTRLPEDIRGSVPEDLRAAFDALVADSGGSVPVGPGAVAALSPEMALRRRPLSNYVRWELKLPQNVQEVAILWVAVRFNCQYVWNAHAPLARKAGVTPGFVEALRDDTRWPDQLDPDERMTVAFVNQLIGFKEVSDRVFNEVVERFGMERVVDLIALIGQYVTNACFLNAFELPLPPSDEPILPPGPFQERKPKPS